MRKRQALEALRASEAKLAEVGPHLLSTAGDLHRMAARYAMAGNPEAAMAQAIAEKGAAMREAAIVKAFQSLPAEAQLAHLQRLYGDKVLAEALQAERMKAQADRVVKNAALEMEAYKRLNTAALPPDTLVAVGFFDTPNYVEDRRGVDMSEASRVLRFQTLAEPGHVRVLADYYNEPTDETYEEDMDYVDEGLRGQTIPAIARLALGVRGAHEPADPMIFANSQLVGFDVSRVRDYHIPHSIGLVEVNGHGVL